MSIKRLVFVRPIYSPPAKDCEWAVDLYSKTGKWTGCTWAKTKKEAQKIARGVTRRRGY